ncbi:cellulose binding domain-containing protein [Glycomyces xiaoerkulensis]|uniref:cellulose binding domain-containing protein n=1 Tax=Glycomyces xiaoerkulensis TaxID=2038139 RepID=UPI0012FFE20E|nr:cellulose binding domain-containing protein [Glycomyces xiaoerkulensis]
MPDLAGRSTKTLLAAVAGLLSSLFIAAPTGADHPEPEPRNYTVSFPGGHPCTIFDISGDIRWAATHPPEQSTVAVTGTPGVSVIDPHPDNPCDSSPVPDFQVEYTFSGSGDELGEHIEPAGWDHMEPFEFTFASDTAIDTVEIAACLPPSPEGPTGPDRCGESETVGIDDVPRPPHCEYTYTVDRWDGGFNAEIAVTPLVRDSTGWSIYVPLADDFTVITAWNAEWSVGGLYLMMEDAHWNGEIPVGEAAQVGFMGTGEAPPPSEIEVYMHGYTCADSETV